MMSFLKMLLPIARRWKRNPPMFCLTPHSSRPLLKIERFWKLGCRGSSSLIQCRGLCVKVLSIFLKFTQVVAACRWLWKRKACPSFLRLSWKRVLTCVKDLCSWACWGWLGPSEFVLFGLRPLVLLLAWLGPPNCGIWKPPGALTFYTRRLLGEIFMPSKLCCCVWFRFSWEGFLELSNRLGVSWELCLFGCCFAF